MKGSVAGTGARALHKIAGGRKHYAVNEGLLAQCVHIPARGCLLCCHCPHVVIDSVVSVEMVSIKERATTTTRAERFVSELALIFPAAKSTFHLCVDIHVLDIYRDNNCIFIN